MEKNNLVYIGIALIAVILIGLMFLSENSERNTIKIGAILPLTGAASYAGIPLQYGMQIAVEEINNAGGIDGKRIELIIEDSKTNPQEGVTVFKLMAAKNPKVVITALSSVSLALAPLAEEYKIPVLATTTAAPDVSKKNDYMVRYFPTAEQEVSQIVSIANVKDIRKIAVLYLSDDFGNSMYSETIKQFDGEIIGETFQITTADFKTQLFKIKDQNPDGILIVGFSSHVVNAIRQIKELDINAVIFGSSTTSSPDIRLPLKEIGVEVYAGSAGIYRENPPEEFVIFKEKLEARTNKDLDEYGVTGYDSIMLMKQVIQENGQSSEQIKQGLLNIQHFEGLFGNALISVREINPPLYKVLVKDGKVQYLE